MATPDRTTETPQYDQVLKLVGQLSPDEQEQLRLNLNSKWIFWPKNQAMDQLRKEALQALTHAGVTVEELKQEVDRIKEERFAERYPGLGE
jgi:hypothetical protein